VGQKRKKKNHTKRKLIEVVIPPLPIGGERGEQKKKKKEKETEPEDYFPFLSDSVLFEKEERAKKDENVPSTDAFFLLPK